MIYEEIKKGALVASESTDALHLLRSPLLTKEGLKQKKKVLFTKMAFNHEDIYPAVKMFFNSELRLSTFSSSAYLTTMMHGKGKCFVIPFKFLISI